MSASTVSGANTCGSFVWTISQQSDGVISGLFSARCASTLNVSGSAWGRVNGTTLTMITTAGGTGPGAPGPCDVSFTSTATLDPDAIHIPYSGATCLGLVSGTEVLKRQ